MAGEAFALAAWPRSCTRSHDVGIGEPLGLTQAELAATLGTPQVEVNAIINGRRSLTPGTAMRLAKALGTTPEFWINGQIAVDL